MSAPSTLRYREFRVTSPQSQTLARLSRLLIQPLLGTLMRTPLAFWPISLPEKFAHLRGVPANTTCAPEALPDCTAEWVTHADADRASASGRVILYMHGGAFLCGGLNTHRQLLGNLSRASRAPVLAVNYRMMPLCTVADALADSLSGYRHLLEAGYAPAQITLAGDSAGGYLALALAMTIRDDPDLPNPGAVVAISPLTTFDNRWRTTSPNIRRDPLFTVPLLGKFEALTQKINAEALTRRGQHPPVDPGLSDLTGLPPTMILVGSTELLAVDARLVADRLERGGVLCELQVWRNQLHVFPVLIGLVPEAIASVKHMGRFICENTSVTHASVPA